MRTRGIYTAPETSGTPASMAGKEVQERLF
jgi:hypothetical protein